VPSVRRPTFASPPQIATEIRGFSRTQWQVGAGTAVAAFLLMGVVGETLPVASIGREAPVEWWNYLTLVLSPILIGLVAATFAREDEPEVARPDGTKAGAGVGGLIGTVAMACPACSPLAIPLFGTAGVLSFLGPDRGLIALLSIALLAMTLSIRVGGSQACRLPIDSTTTT
jgi:hypothetical protein